MSAFRLLQSVKQIHDPCRCCQKNREARRESRGRPSADPSEACYDSLIEVIRSDWHRESNMNATTAANVRRVIAGHFGVKLDRVVDGAALRDLGADWLDRLELLIMIEDQVPEANVSDLVADHIETVGDLIRVVEDSAARPKLRRSKLGVFSS